jgi:hypothetical protein
MGLMGAVTISVQADSEAEAVAWLEKLCTLGVVPKGRPVQVPGRERWIVRPEPRRGKEQAG